MKHQALCALAEGVASLDRRIADCAAQKNASGLEACLEAVGKNPDSAVAHYNLGVAFYEQGGLEAIAECGSNPQEPKPPDAVQIPMSTYVELQGREKQLREENEELRAMLSRQGQENREKKAPLSRMPTGNFLYTDIPYHGRIIPEVEMSAFLLDDRKKNQKEWAKCSFTDDENWSFADAEILYQCMRRPCLLLFSPQYSGIARDAIDFFRETFEPDMQFVCTATQAGYRYKPFGNDCADISRIAMFPGSMFGPDRANFDFCRYRHRGISLAKKKPVKDLDQKIITTAKEIPSETRPFLQALLGEGYWQAGAIFQSCSSNDRFPTKLNSVSVIAATRPEESGYAVVFGVFHDKFKVDAYVSQYDRGHAIGVRIPLNQKPAESALRRL